MLRPKFMLSDESSCQDKDAQLQRETVAHYISPVSCERSLVLNIASLRTSFYVESGLLTRLSNVGI